MHSKWGAAPLGGLLCNPAPPEGELFCFVFVAFICFFLFIFLTALRHFALQPCTPPPEGNYFYCLFVAFILLLFRYISEGIAVAPGDGGFVCSYLILLKFSLFRCENYSMKSSISQA
jgi:hypothetical protein